MQIHCVHFPASPLILIMQFSLLYAQDLGTPVKADGSGFFVINRVNLDSRMLINIDEAKLQGHLTLKAIDVCITLTTLSISVIRFNSIFNLQQACQHAIYSTRSTHKSVLTNRLETEATNIPG